MSHASEGHASACPGRAEYLFSAEGAAFIRKPGATPRGFAQHQTVSAESAIHSRANRCRINDEPVR